MEFKQSPNFTAGNGTFKPIGFVIHGTLGKYEGAVDWLCTAPQDRPDGTASSAHLIVAKDGRATQIVKNTDISWHAGNVSNPTALAKQFVKMQTNGKYVNPNSLFIGIENEWLDGDRDKPQQLTNEQLDIMAKYIFDSGIKNPVILLHAEITDYKADFRKRDGTIDTSIRDEIVKRLAKLNMPVTPVSTPIQQPSTPPAMSREQTKAEISRLLAAL